VVAGAGARIEPVALVVVTKGRAKLLPLKSRDAALTCLFDAIPDVLGAFRHMFSRKRGNRKPFPEPGFF
jgi:uncharacterized spore protein YtfJ